MTVVAQPGRKRGKWDHLAQRLFETPAGMALEIPVTPNFINAIRSSLNVECHKRSLIFRSRLSLGKTSLIVWWEAKP
jgi:hypothetical protein